jgi:hypothetical protein
MSYRQERESKLMGDTWGLSPEEREAKSKESWLVIRREYEEFTDSLTVEQLVRHKKLVVASGHGWEYWVTPRLQGWDGSSDARLPQTSKTTTPDHPRMPKSYRY